MKNCFSVFVFCFFSSCILSQDLLVLTTPIDSFISLNDYIVTYVDSTRSATYEDVLQEEFLPDILNGTSYDKDIWNSFYWRKFKVKNNTTAPISISISSKRFVLSNAYIHVDGELLDTISFGPRIPHNDWELEYSMDAFNLELLPDADYTILIHSKRPMHRAMTLSMKLYSPDYFKNMSFKNIFYLKELYYWQLSFIAILCFLLCFTVFQYFQHRDISYFYYSCYLLVMAVYFLQRHETSTYINLFFSYQSRLITHFTGGEPSLISQFVFVFYMLFAESFLDIKKNYPPLSKVLRRSVYAIIAIYLIQVLIYVVDIKPSFSYYFNMGFRTVLNILFIAILLTIYLKIKTRLSFYFLIGSIALLVGSIVSNYWNTLQFTPMRDPIIWTQIGTLVECLFFSAGLGYKSKLVLDDKNRTQDELIKKLEENKILQEQLNQKLRQEVDLKNKEKKTVDYENKILMLESELLTSQMNPHFIFNSLNSIKYYALTKPSVETAKFVTSFAKLMRIILNSSKRKTISMREEIEFLDTYLAVELKRFDKKFTYEIFVDDIIDLDETFIPPMLLQPYIENALWHGLLHKDSAGKISISATQNHDGTIFVIEDNGIGRVASEKIKKSKGPHRPASHGTTITSNRLQLLNEIYKIKASIQIEDLINRIELSCGTRITLQIPYLS